MKVTSINHEPGQYGPIWWGTATKGDDNIEWFYEPGISLNVRREVHLGMWMPMRPTPRAIKLAVLEAVRNSKHTYLH